MASHTFKLGIFLNELQLPLDDGLEEANELGVEFVWFTGLPGMPDVADLSDSEADDIQRRIEAAGLEHMKVSAGSPFKFLDLTEVTVDNARRPRRIPGRLSRDGALDGTREPFRRRCRVGLQLRVARRVHCRQADVAHALDDARRDHLRRGDGQARQGVHADGRAGRETRRRSRPVHDALELYEHNR